MVKKIETSKGVSSIAPRLKQNIKYAAAEAGEIFKPEGKKLKRLSRDLSKENLLGGRLSKHENYEDVQAVKPKKRYDSVAKNLALAGITSVLVTQIHTQFITDWSAKHLASLEELPKHELISRSPMDKSVDFFAESVKFTDEIINKIGDRGMWDVPGIDVPFVDSPFKNRALWPFHNVVSSLSIFLTALGAARKNSKTASIRPGELLRGFGSAENKSVIGVVDQTSAKGKFSDSGSKPFQTTQNIPKDIKVILSGQENPGDFYLRKIPLDADPDHGTRVSDIFAGGASGAVKSLVFVKPDIPKDAYKQLEEFFEQGEKDPSSMNIQKLNECSKPIVDSIALAVRDAINNGAEDINVSLSADQPGKLNIAVQSAASLLGMSALQVGNFFHEVRAFFNNDYAYSSEYTTIRDQIADKREKAQLFRDALKKLYRSHGSENIEEGHLSDLYSSWDSVLKYADQVSDNRAKEISIHVSYGNMGNYANSARNANVLGLSNLIASLAGHPRLHFYGSHRVEGGRNIISEFTSEGSGDPETLPDVFGNGENIIFAEPRLNIISLAYSFWLNPWSIFKPTKQYEGDRFAQGTSFASPHGAAVSTATKAYFRDNDIRLTSAAYELLLRETADPVSFSSKYLEKVLIPEITERLAIQREEEASEVPKNLIINELEQEAKRRGGYGAINAQRMKEVSDDLIKWAKEKNYFMINTSRFSTWLNQQISN
ncbi:MAG: hypothetical protein QNJ31_07105 [Candidatus Caenarcaniphilales bacterium]|nr:hypothetical protein [Candidatus Caenarcaniphilales bacterium]